MTTTTTSIPYAWLKKIPEALIQLDEIPLMGKPPEFPWEALEKHLIETFELKSLKLKHSEWQWRSKDKLLTGLGGSLATLQLTFPSLEGTAYWVMTEKDIKRLMSLLLTQKARTVSIDDADLQDGFYQFLAIEVIQALNRLEFDSVLSPRIHSEGELPKEATLCKDVSATIGRNKISGRLLLSSELRSSLKQHYAQSPSETLLNPEFSHQVAVDVHLEIGKTALKWSEWATVSPGDFIILDSCSWQPEKEKARVMLCIHGTPFFRGRIKQGQIKILEHPLYHEANMDENLPEDEFDENSDVEGEFEESEEYTDEPSEDEFPDEASEDEFPDESSEEEFPEEHTDEEFPEEHTDEELPEEEEEASSEDMELSHEEEHEGEETPESTVVEAPEAPAKSIKAKLEPSEKGVKSPEEIPLPVTVEVGRIRMTVQKLMELQPGNILELDIRPEDGVELMVSGKRIAKGELLQVGDVLGVRILEKG